MTTTVTLTGTGVPHVAPGRAGAGVLVSYDSCHLQFDAGRATVLRLAEAGVTPGDLAAQFVTHYHSDHVVDLVDVVMTRWIMGQLRPAPPLDVVVPDGPAATFVRRMLDPYEDDVSIRREHVGSPAISINVLPFVPTSTSTVVWRSPDGRILVEAVGVHHEPVEAAVAYRVTTPDGVVVVSGDTRVCDEVFELARDSDVLVHEACRKSSMATAIAGSAFEKIFDYHADTTQLGEFAQRFAIRPMVLTHLIPQPRNERDVEGFERDLRNAGYTGRVTVGQDLDRVVIG
ncbi:MAG: MBL fold metallo-hydrolase [Ilumatobacteraceae bacterium]